MLESLGLIIGGLLAAAAAKHAECLWKAELLQGAFHIPDQSKLSSLLQGVFQSKGGDVHKDNMEEDDEVLHLGDEDLAQITAIKQHKIAEAVNNNIAAESSEKLSTLLS